MSIQDYIKRFTPHQLELLGIKPGQPVKCGQLGFTHKWVTRINSRIADCTFCGTTKHWSITKNISSQS